MDYSILARELIRALRGRRSQTALSRRLGYSTNVLYGWESGHRAPKASAFFQLAGKQRADLRGAVASFVSAPLKYELDMEGGVMELLNVLARGRGRQELARAIGSDRTTVARWLEGRTEPKLPELLAFVSATSQRLLEFLALFVDPEQLASAREAQKDLAEQRKLAYEMPWSHAVLRVLELDSYRMRPRHSDAFVAQQVGISVVEVRAQLAALLAAKQIRRVRGRYVIQRVLTIDTRLREDANRQIKQHWARVALDRFTAAETPPEALFSFNLFAVGEQELARIRQLHLDYYERVREIIAESESAQHVVLMNVQLIPLRQR